MLERRLGPFDAAAIIIANAVNFADADEIYAAGADYVFMSRLDSAAALDDAIVRALGGTIKDYRYEREREHGEHSSRTEILP